MRLGIIDHMGEHKRFDSMIQLKMFCEDELAFWSKESKLIGNKPRSNFFDCVTGFKEIIASIGDVDGEDSTAASHISNVEQAIDKRQSHLNRNWLWSGHPYIQVFIQLSVVFNDRVANAFIHGLRFEKPEGDSISINSLSSLIGFVKAIEFLKEERTHATLQDSSQMSYNDLVRRLEKGMREVLSRHEQGSKEFSEWVNNRKVDVLKQIEEYSDKMNVQIQRVKTLSTEQIEASKKRFNEIESKHIEQMRMKGPASYWEKARANNMKQSIVFGLVLMFWVGGGIITGLDYMSKWLGTKEIGVDLNSLQGIILFGSILAIYIFGVQIFSKLFLSSLHLMRDAEERLQLTHLYLSLINESSVDESSRDIILQALFSRADSGLLKGDHSPKMPFTAEALNKILNTN